MEALYITCIVLLGFMTVVNLMLWALADEDLAPPFFVNFLVLAFGVVTVAIALSR